MLTALGEQLLPMAHHTLAALNDLVSDAGRSGQTHHGPLRLGVIPTVAPYLLPTILEAHGFSESGAGALQAETSFFSSQTCTFHQYSVPDPRGLPA